MVEHTGIELLRYLIPSWGTVFYRNTVRGGLRLFVQFDGEYVEITLDVADALSLFMREDGSVVHRSVYTMVGELAPLLYPGAFTSLKVRSMTNAPKRW